MPCMQKWRAPQRTIAPKQSYSTSATASLMNLSAVVQMSTKCLGFYKCKYFFGINWKHANRSPIGIRSSVVRHAPRLSPCTSNVFTQNPKNSSPHRPHRPHPLSNLCCTKSRDKEFFSTSRITWAVQAKPPTSHYLELMSTPCALLKQRQCN